MSGFSPRGEGVGTGNFPGCIETPSSGNDGQNSWHQNPTSGNVDANGCAIDGSKITRDEINGIEQSLNCILTEGDTVPLPATKACDDPCMLWNTIKNYVDNSLDLCDLQTLSEEELNDESNETFLVLCHNNSNYKIPYNTINGSDYNAECLLHSEASGYSENYSITIPNDGQSYVGFFTMSENNSGNSSQNDTSTAYVILPNGYNVDIRPGGGDVINSFAQYNGPQPYVEPAPFEPGQVQNGQLISPDINQQCVTLSASTLTNEGPSESQYEVTRSRSLIIYRMK